MYLPHFILSGNTEQSHYARLFHVLMCYDMIWCPIDKLFKAIQGPLLYRLIPRIFYLFFIWDYFDCMILQRRTCVIFNCNNSLILQFYLLFLSLQLVFWAQYPCYCFCQYPCYIGELISWLMSRLLSRNLKGTLKRLLFLMASFWSSRFSKLELLNSTIELKCSIHKTHL